MIVRRLGSSPIVRRLGSDKIHVILPVVTSCPSGYAVPAQKLHEMQLVGVVLAHQGQVGLPRVETTIMLEELMLTIQLGADAFDLAQGAP